MDSQAWGNTGACSGTYEDDSVTDCSIINDGILSADECSSLCGNTCSDSQYCDCGSATCKFKPGFTAATDLSAAARCGLHGHPVAKYLGGDLPVTSHACLCDDGWSGPLCQFNPCQELGLSCGSNGVCIALSDTEAQCKCDLGYSGEYCDVSCDLLCPGNGGIYPYGCNANLGPEIVLYGCGLTGGCSYLTEGQEMGSSFCTFKEVTSSSTDCICGGDNDCEKSVTCNSDGSCPPPQYLPDFTACNSVPFGVCQAGTCLENGATASPSVSPTTATPTTPQTSSPTTPLPTSSPTPKPTLLTSILISEWTNPNDQAAPFGTYFSFDEADWVALFGPLCQVCKGISCGQNGECVAISETEARCACDVGFSGDNCSVPIASCEGVCIGSWPYNCNPNLSGVVEYGCHSGGGCNYLQPDGEYPYAGFCTFKYQDYGCLDNGSVFKINQLRGGQVIWSGDVRVWPASSDTAYGHIEPLGTGGVFQTGDQIKPWAPVQTTSPSQSPTDQPSSSPSKSPTIAREYIVILLQ